LKRKILIFLVAGILLGLAGSQWLSERKIASNKETSTEATADKAENKDLISHDPAEVHSDQIPSKVYDILKYVNTFHEPKEGYVGGRKFHNYENKLPKVSPDGKKIYYQEWDVNPKRNRINRGKERLVTGDDHSAWYTNNHYQSFIQIK
jgi:ribonuclease T1